MKYLHYIPLVFLTFFLSCTSFEPKEDPTIFYQLSVPSVKSDILSQKEFSSRLILLPVETPDYLDRDNYVSGGQGNRVIVHAFDRWIEPLSEALEDRITQGLRNRLQIAVEQANHPIEEYSSLAIVVEEFICSEEEVRVRFFVTRIDDGDQSISRVFEKKDFLKGDGIDLEVQMLSSLLDQILDEISEWITFAR